jgi:hypothetical protein
MTGGIFTEHPFYPNPKCVLFSTSLMAFYWYLPATKNVFMLPIIFIISYIAMAWYDYIYDCNIVMRSGSYIGPNTFDSIFKPQRRNEETTYDVKLSPNQEKEYLSRVYLFHVLAVVPLLLYIGYRGDKSDVRAYPALFVFGLVALMYHGTRMFLPRETNC